MGIEHTIPDLDRSGLRRFGVTTGAIVGVLFGAILPWSFGLNYPLWPWGVFLALGSWGLLHPASLGPVYRGWMRFGLVISRVTTPLIMGTVFYVVVVPFGLAMRLFGKDPMRRKLDANATSYRVASARSSRENLERPF